MASPAGGVSGGVLTYDAFIALRETQDGALRREFANVHTRIDDVNARIDDFRDDVGARFDTVHTRIDDLRDDVNARFDDFRDDLTQVKLGIQRSEASAYNARLRNPLREITFIPAYDLATRRIQTPAIRPMNAKQFFKLRELSSDADKKLLHYLVDFYDLGVLDDETGGSNSGTSSSEEESDTARRTFKPGERVPLDPYIAVERLAAIYGLEEDNFVDFQHRAAAFARDVPPPTAPKRPAGPPQYRPFKRVELPEVEQALARMPLEKMGMPNSTHSSRSDSLEQEQDRLRWGTPSEVGRERLLRSMGLAGTDRKPRESDPGDGAKAPRTLHEVAMLEERRRTNLREPGRISVDSPPRESIPAEESPAIPDRESHKSSTHRGQQSTDPRPEEGSPTDPISSGSLNRRLLAHRGRQSAEARPGEDSPTNPNTSSSLSQ